jgi:hypothetical protein
MHTHLDVAIPYLTSLASVTVLTTLMIRVYYTVERLLSLPIERNSGFLLWVIILKPTNAC